MWPFIHSAASLAWDQATKIWGDPVLEGVAGFLGQLLQTSNAETQEMFATISPDRFWWMDTQGKTIKAVADIYFLAYEDT